MPKFVQTIEQNKASFSKPPILIGAKVRVLPGEERWANALQASIGRVMASFLVNNLADANVLYKLGKDCGVPKVSLSSIYSGPVLDEIESESRLTCTLVLKRRV